MINISNISKSFDDRVILEDISFSIKNGDKIAIIGQSGIGKSVLLKSIIGLLNPDEGEIFMTHPYADVFDEDYSAGKLAPHIQIISSAFPSTSGQ